MQPLTADYRKNLFSFQILSSCSAKMRQLISLQSVMVCYYKVRQVLQSATEQRFNHVELPKYGYMHVGMEKTYMELWSFPVL